VPPGAGVLAAGDVRVVCTCYEHRAAARVPARSHDTCARAGRLVHMHHPALRLPHVPSAVVGRL